MSVKCQHSETRAYPNMRQLRPVQRHSWIFLKIIFLLHPLTVTLSEKQG